ncbi:MAG TPA: hypothetical protein VHG89_03795 [Verrucomicrobiae bacterium]|nr:hypothetical protein [Verrucomicrobiae bacterium]
MQLELTGLAIEARRPLLPVEAVVFMVNRDGDEIAADCERGMFKFAFDISTPGAQRRELRIYRDCVLQSLQPKLALPEKLSDVFERIFPHRGLRGVELQRTFSCSLQHVRDLDDAALITVERERLAASGPRASRIYSRQSIITFLQSRAIGGNPLMN